MEGTTRKVKMFDMKPWTSSSSLAWALLPTALGSVVKEEDYCAVPLLSVLQGCPVTLGNGAQSWLSYTHAWSPQQPPSLAQSPVLMCSSASKMGGKLEALQGGVGVDLCLSEALIPSIRPSPQPLPLPYTSANTSTTCKSLVQEL